jgi:hypothetical protein
MNETFVRAGHVCDAGMTIQALDPFRDSLLRRETFDDPVQRPACKNCEKCQACLPQIGAFIARGFGNAPRAT